MAEYQAVSHIAICVRDMEKSLAFYRDALGMKVISDRMTDPGEGGRFTNYTAPRQSRRHVSLALVDGARPTLTITSHPGESLSGQAIKLDDVGITHFSITVPDVRALAARLQENGVKLAGTMESFVNRQGQVRSIYVHDPDGILIQFDSGGAA